MNILSIQSQVVYGHVGNSAAAFVLQRQGHAVWQVPTVLFSNHLGKPTFRGRAVPAEQARELIQGLKELGYLDDVDMLLTGYLGTPDTARLAAERPRTCCCPALGAPRTLRGWRRSWPASSARRSQARFSPAIR